MMNRIIFYIIILLLFLPVIQIQTKFFSFEKLEGSFYPVEDVDISVDTWLENEYQTDKEKYLKDNLGFRLVFIRLYNQMLYSFYSMANNPGGVVGKENYLYLTDYVYNYTGENYIGDKKIKTRVENLKRLQNFFNKKNISLLTVFVPSKASFYPEYIPDHYKKYPKTNYSAFIEAYKENDLNYIDLVSYFNEIKDTTTIPLFPKNGLHWSSYGMALGIDTMIKTIETLRKVDLPDLSWKTPIELDDSLRKPDFDIEKIMNLLFYLPKDSMPYPNFVFNKKAKAHQKVYVISDSYYWQVYTAQIHHNIFDWGGFCYYNKTLHRNINKKETSMPIKNLDMYNELLEQDVIVLFVSQATLHLFPYGFDKEAGFLVEPTGVKFTEEYYRNEIENNTKFRNSIIEKSIKNNIDYNTQLDLDIKWILKNKRKEYYVKQYQIKKYADDVYSNPEKLNLIKQKAKKQGIGYGKLILLEANEAYNNSKNKN